MTAPDVQRVPATPVAGTVQAAVTAVVGLGALVAVVVVALRLETGQRIDEEAMTAVVERRDAHLSVLSVLGYVSIGAIGLVAATCIGVALVRGSVRLALAAGTVLVGANVTTQLLKHWVLDRPDLGHGILNSLPSGHTTVVASAAAALALVVPRTAQPLVAAAAAFTVTMTGASTVVAGWHRPSDVVAACAVTLVWTGVAAILGGRHRTPAKGLAAAALAGAVLSCLTLVAIGVRPTGGWDGFSEAALVLGATGLVVAGWSWATTRLGG